MIKKKVCPDCEGHGEIHFVSENRFEPCNTCWYKGYIEVPMTNADNIREMSDKQLAIFLNDVYHAGYGDGLVNNGINIVVCFNNLTQWLQEEYEEYV
jgi:DnaJ-class molecular chaperone